jgi:hypothetical protein
MDRADVDAGHCAVSVVFKIIGFMRFSSCSCDASTASCRKPLCRASTNVECVIARRAVNRDGKGGILRKFNDRCKSKSVLKRAQALEVREMHAM